MESCPIDDYDDKTVGEVEDAVSPYTNGLRELNDGELNERLEIITAVRDYETSHKDRVTANDSIGDVLDQIETEATNRGLITPDDESTDASTDGDSAGETDAGDDTSDESDSETSTEDEAETDSESTEVTTEPDVVDDDEESELDSRNPDDATFKGVGDDRERIIVRNPEKTGKHAAGESWGAGEAKDLVVNDRILQAIRQGELQVVKG